MNTPPYIHFYGNTPVCCAARRISLFIHLIHIRHCAACAHDDEPAVPVGNVAVVMVGATPCSSPPPLLPSPQAAIAKPITAARAITSGHLAVFFITRFFMRHCRICSKYINPQEAYFKICRCSASSLIIYHLPVKKTIFFGKLCEGDEPLTAPQNRIIHAYMGHAAIELQ